MLLGGSGTSTGSSWRIPSSFGTATPAPSAAGGSHTPGFHFGGNGGPGGDFDWEIGSPSGGPLDQQVLDTTITLITNSTHTAQQTVINGQVEVRNLTIWSNGRLVVQGPNPCIIHASGSVTIEGKLIVKGNNNRGVTSFNTANIPEPGSAGQAGGGRGGTGSPLTTQSDPQGSPGFGAFDSPGTGGGGGESGYSDGGINSRRPGGGGGGALRVDVLRPSPNPNACPEQFVIGLDAERGFNGTIGDANFTTSGAISGPGQQPQGGAVGQRPFIDVDINGAPNVENDFWGTLITQDDRKILGELLQPWAGAGGGAGGDSVKSATFPQVPFSVLLNQKGAGGGGGGGCLLIFARGDIKLIDFGSIDASGGTGGGGENTNGINRVGGGSGGGSGGHIVLQTASKLDLSEVKALAPYPSAQAGGIYALGGQGGEGMFGLGGAQANGVATTPLKDALPPNHYPSNYPGDTSNDGPCAVAGNTVGNLGAGGAGPVDVVYGCGGDGGPGVIQLHAPSLDHILPPVSLRIDLGYVVKPPPVGSVPETVHSPRLWDRLLPVIGASQKSN
jgi:hypothetical protein